MIISCLPKTNVFLAFVNTKKNINMKNVCKKMEKWFIYLLRKAVASKKVRQNYLSCLNKMKCESAFCFNIAVIYTIFSIQA